MESGSVSFSNPVGMNPCRQLLQHSRFIPENATDKITDKIDVDLIFTTASQIVESRQFCVRFVQVEVVQHHHLNK